MSSGKYSKGGKKLGDDISLTQKLSQERKTEKGREKSGRDDGSASAATPSGNEAEVTRAATDKKNRKRKKESLGQSPESSLAATDDLSETSSSEKRASRAPAVDSPPPPPPHGRASAPPLLRPPYLDENGATTTGATTGAASTTTSTDDPSAFDDQDYVEYPPVRRPIFVPFALDSAVAFLPNGSGFSFKGKVLLERVVVGCLHCLGGVFGTGDSRKPWKLFSPDSTSLLTVEDFNDGDQDVDEDEFRALMREVFAGKEVDDEGELLRKLATTYVDNFVVVGERSTAPSVAIFERFDHRLCDSLSSFSGQFRHLFAEKPDGRKKKCVQAGATGAEGDGAVGSDGRVDEGEMERSSGTLDIYPVASIGIHAFHFDGDDEEEMNPAPAPWQRPTLIPTTHWKAIERLVEDGGGGGGGGGGGDSPRTDASSPSSGEPAASPTETPPPLKVVVVGGKNCGKSTFARVAVNALLCAKRAPEAGGGFIFPDGLFFLDADVGQCEFTPSSFVSLIHVRRPVIGPPFTHLAAFPDARDEGNDAETPTIVSMAFGGGNSPGTAPSLYTHALRRVYRAYEDHPLVKKWRRRGCRRGKNDNHEDDVVAASPAVVPPLIVNTMGWNKGLGLALMVDSFRLLSPSHVVQLDSSSAAKNFPPITNDFVRCNPGWKSRVAKPFQTKEKYDDASGGDGVKTGSSQNLKEHELISVFSPVGHLALEGSNKYRPPDLRLLTLLAHWFVKDEATDATSPPAPIPAILSVSPYKIPLRRLTLHVTHSNLKNAQLLYAFNGSLVALGVQTPPRSAVAPTGDPNYLGPRFFASRASAASQGVEAVGLGLVRGIDLDAHQLYLSTLVPSRILARVDTLIMGDMDLPAEIKQVRPPTEVLTTRSIPGGIFCDIVEPSEEGIGAAAALSDGEEGGYKPLPYMTVDHRTTIGSGGLGNTHKAPIRENKPGSVGRRNDLVRW